MELSNNLKRRFLKDYQLPIQIVKEPYFGHLLSLYEPVLKSMSHFEKLKETLACFNNEEEFFVHANHLSNTVIEHVANKSSYNNFCSFDMKSYKPLHNIGTQKLYQRENANKHFIAVDLKKANFQALKCFDKDLVDGFENYKEFLESIVDTFDYFIDSKQVRQVIFGNLSPKRQQTIQKYLISLIVDALLEKGFNEDDIFSTTADEVVISTNEVSQVEKAIEWLREKYPMCHDLSVHVESFTLEQIHEEHSFFVKRHDNGKIEFKGVPSFNMPEAFKFYFNMPLDEKDLYFFHEGRIAKFEEPLLV